MGAILPDFDEIRNHIAGELLATDELIGGGGNLKLTAYLLRLEDRLSRLADEHQELKSRLETLEGVSKQAAKAEAFAG